MKLRSTILACLAALLASAAPAAAATPSAPAYIDISVQQNIDWRDGLTVRFLPDEKLCRSKYGSKQWQTACGASLGEDGEQVKGISISPQIPGSWRWTGSSEARFIPREPLSPSMTYTVDTSAMRIPSSVRLSRPQAKITTLPAAVSMPQHSVWVDPSARAAHMLSARMTFSYPVRNPSPDLFIVKKTPGSEGLRLGSLKQIWNAEKDSVMLTVPLLSLPHDKGGISFDVTGYPAYSVKDGGIVLSSAKGRNASWMVPVQSSPFVVKRTTLNAVSTETLDKTWELEVSLSMHVRSDELAKSIIVGELPLHNTPGADRPYDWDKAGRIPVALMEQAAPLRLTPMQPGDFASGTLRYRVSPRPGYSIFVKVPESVTSAAGSKLARSWLSIHKAYEFGTELRLLQPGSILPLRGDRKIDIQAMGLDSVRWSATRVRKPFLAMLGALDGTFAAPLENSSVDFDLLGEPAGTGTTALPPSRSGKAQFAALDLSSVLSTAPSGAPRGLLQLKIDGMRKDEEACSLSRFILVTDLGLIVKKTLTGALDVFACSLSQGKPAAGVKISVLSRNGLPCAEAKTDAEGRTSLPSLAGMPPEKSPVAVIAEGAEGDLAWMPLNDYSRRADYSSFSVGGRSAGSEGLNAHVFSQRGVYRPGEMLHFGCILRRTDWNPIPAGMPLLAVLTDPSGKELFRRNFSSSAEGLAEFDWTSDENSRTGRYTLDIRIPGSRGSVIGTASVLVRDFMPETMRMKAEMVPASPRGWIYTGDGASPEVRALLTDLYGAAGAGRRVTARLVTESAQLSSFAEWPGYTFCDPSEGTQYAEKDLPEVRTADDGSVTIPMPAGVAAASSAACMVELRGFEPDGGRSVTASASAVLSPRKALVGYRPDGSVPRADFIPQGRHAGMNIIAIGPDLRSTSLENLTLTVAERRFVSNLVSDSRGAFRYAETPVDKEISRTSASLPADGGLNWTIPTDLPGDFILKISDASGEVLATAPFTVVGERLRGSAETTDAGIRLHLAKTEYRAGETVEMSMTVPYDGAGLITIERDGVYAHRWFSAKAGDTVQSIAIPASFEGRGYVNVAFARAAGSRDIYLTPFACAAAPFNVGTEGRDLGLRIEAPAKSLPGEPLKVRLTSRSAGKALVFAVDEGVLQLTRFALPDPLRHLLKDRALDVTTLQAFDLVMPDHGIMKSRIPGFGGGDALAAAAMAGMQNPFKRRGEPPVAWWSGIVDVSADGTELAIPLPDWCGTTVRIMAVGSSPSLAGSARAQTVVRGNIVITPQMPLAAAPGDVFEAAVAVSAPEDASGAVRVSMKADEALSIEGPAEFEIPAGTVKETIRTFRVRVNEKPGDAGILFTAVDAGGRTVERRGSMSVRPASAKASGLTAGIATGPLAVSTPRDLIPYGAQTTLSVSTLPVPAVRGLAAFLDGWSYGCTEQLISKAFPYALLRSRPELLAGPSRPAEKVVRDADRRIDDALAALSERRSGDDRVAWWPGGEGSDFLTAYAADFLMTLREEGIGVPGGLLESICDAAERFAGTSVTDNEDARLKAYAIWVLSREGRVMTHELESLGRYVAENGGMKGDIAPLFIAAAREILHMDWSFTNLSTAGMDENSQFDALSAQGFRSVLTAKYFPNAKGDHAGDLVNAAMTAITSRGYSTFSAAQAIRAVLTSSPDSARALSAVRLGCIAGGSASAQGSDSLPMVSLEAPLCRRFTVDAPENSTLYWMLSTEGYDRTPPAEAESTGMEITRTYLSASGAPVTTVRQGEEITVRITARTYGDSPRDSVIADLLPGGFEQSESSADGTDGVMFADRREDRTLIFAGIGKSFTYTYKIRAVTRGTFTVPSATCEAMYDRTRRARTAAGTITVK